MKKLLMKALKNKFNMQKDDAIALTKTVEKIFNGQKEVEDMSIDKYARSLFYELQREKILKLRTDTIEKQEASLSEQLEKLREEVMKTIKKE